MTNPTDVQKYLVGIEYPCSKRDIIDHAKGQGASDDIISVLQDLPEKDYRNPAEVSSEFGVINEGLEGDEDDTV